MYEIAICDDEAKICELYKDHVNKILKNHELSASIHTFDSELIFLTECMTGRYRLVLLDIDMPIMSGMQIAERMKELAVRPLLVFVTNQDALVYDTFQFQPFAFIRKSHFEEEIESVILRSFETIMEVKSTYSFRHEATLIQVKLTDILYFEASQNYLLLHTVDEVFRLRGTLHTVESELSMKGFIRIHKGFLVNQEAVYQMSGEEVILSSGMRLPIGRINRDEIKQRLMRYMMR